MKWTHFHLRQSTISVFINFHYWWDVYFPPTQSLQPHPVGIVYDLVILCPSVHVSLTVLVTVVCAWQHLHLLSKPRISDVYDEVEPQKPEHSIMSGTSSIFWHKVPWSWTRKKPTDCVGLLNIACGLQAWHKLLESLPAKNKDQRLSWLSELPYIAGFRWESFENSIVSCIYNL